MLKLKGESLEILIYCINRYSSWFADIDAVKPSVEVALKDKKHSEDLIAKILDPNVNIYTLDFYNELRDIVGNEFTKSGLKQDSEPNEFGLRLECLIDEIGRLFM